MKHFVILLASVFCVAAASGQQDQEGQRQYLFEKFESGQVAFKNGTIARAELNYSLITNCFVFIDAADNNLIKELTDLSQVSVISVGNRVFQLTPQGVAVEIVQGNNPTILVEYRGKSTDIGRRTGYGGRSHTAATRTTGVTAGGIFYSLSGDDRWIVTGIEKRYLVGSDNKMKRFLNLKQFQSIHPKQHAAAIKEFADTNAIDFESVEQVVKLCNYAESLK
jgi:hypothetical protein